MMQSHKRNLECSAPDASHVAFENRQIVGDIKPIPPLVNYSYKVLSPRPRPYQTGAKIIPKRKRSENTYTKTLRSIGVTGLHVGCRETDEVCQIDQRKKMECGNSGRSDIAEGLGAEI